MTNQQRNRSRNICIQMEIDRRAMHRVLADMERRAKELPWWNRHIALWVLNMIIPHWCSYRLGVTKPQQREGLTWKSAQRNLWLR